MPKVQGPKLMVWVQSEGWQTWNPGKRGCFHLSPGIGKSQCPSLKAFRQKEFFLTRGRLSLFVLCSLQWIGWGQPILGREICFSQSTNSKANIVLKYHHRYTQNVVWTNIGVPHGLVKMAHKINHQREIHCYLCGILAKNSWPHLIIRTP